MLVEVSFGRRVLLPLPVPIGDTVGEDDKVAPAERERFALYVRTDSDGRGDTDSVGLRLDVFVIVEVELTDPVDV